MYRMEDLLAIQARYNEDGSVTLHQTKYIEKLLNKFMPDGCGNKVQRNSLPYSEDLVDKVLRALDCPRDPAPHPDLLRTYQQRIGALMYLTTSTRVDIAYATHMLARAASRPTEELLRGSRLVLPQSPSFRRLDLPSRVCSALARVFRCVVGSAQLHIWVGHHVAGSRPQLGVH